jgi:diguanylate cyclase (GGDEF)-like protein
VAPQTAAVEPGAGERRAGARPPASTDFDLSELRDFSRTVADIDWLLVILVLLYQVFRGAGTEGTPAILAGLVAFTAMIVGIHYLGLVRRPQRWLIAVETWLMIVFITWVIYHTERLDSPLLNLYLLPIITSALTLGHLATVLQMGLVGACYVLIGYATDSAFFSTLSPGDAALQLAPMLLAAYITTMLSSDILSAMARMKLISETDALTGIYNVRAFNAIAARDFGLAARYKRTLSVMMVDSDNLKKVNDTHGHDAGDQLIRHVVQGIRAELRSTDVAARYGGDEFICLLPETGAAGAAAVAERVRRRVAAQPLEVGAAAVATSVSIGIATYPEHGARLDTLTKNCDRALYVSKAQGRNRVAVYAAD